jgi:hypothetical protein
MKSLSKKTSRTLKFLLLFSFLLGGAHAQVVVSSDRFLFKFYDRTISLQDFSYQSRNLDALACLFDDAILIQYFEKSFLKDLSAFVRDFPREPEKGPAYLHQHAVLMKRARVLFKMLRYSQDQNRKIPEKLTQLIRENTRANRCHSDILYKDSLKTNFQGLLELELYLRSRYEGQVKVSKSFDVVRPSIDLFADSLDKQFAHEYFW